MIDIIRAIVSTVLWPFFAIFGAMMMIWGWIAYAILWSSRADLGFAKDMLHAGLTFAMIPYENWHTVYSKEKSND